MGASGRKGIEGNEKAAFLDLMRQMLSFRPGDRPTAEVLLTSEWMVKWALPDFMRSLKYSLEAIETQDP